MALGEEHQARDATGLDITSVEVTGTPSNEPAIQHSRQTEAGNRSESSCRATKQPADREPWCHGLRRQFRHEVHKAIHLQLDCSLYGRDWRIVYGGSSIRHFGPWLMLVLRAAFLITHTSLLLIDRTYNKMLYFTSWTNVMALILYFTSTISSMAAIGSLSRQRRMSENSLGLTTSNSLVACFGRAESQYELLTRHKTEKNPVSHPTARKCSPMRKDAFFIFRRPFSGMPRAIALESLLVINDIAVTLTLPMVVTIFVIYWGVLFPHEGSKRLGFAIYMHLFSPVTSWLLVALSRFPYRLCLVSIFLFLGTTYVIMLVIMQSFGKGFVYWFLNFRTHPGLASGICVGLIWVCGPLLTCLMWIILQSKTAAIDSPPHEKAKLNVPHSGSFKTQKDCVVALLPAVEQSSGVSIQNAPLEG